MLSVTKSTQFTQNTVLIEGVCLSTDTKPTTGIANGSTIIEINTGKTYMFDEDSSEWDEIGSGGGGGGGGGGSSDYSIAKVTITSSTATDFNISVPNIFQDEMYSILTKSDVSGGDVQDIVLYKGKATAVVRASNGDVTIQTTGDISDSGMFITITGDGTIAIS